MAGQLGAVGIGKVRGYHAPDMVSRPGALNDAAAAAMWPFREHTPGHGYYPLSRFFLTV